MKKQASDQQFHDRRYQERKRAEAARKVVAKKAESVTSRKDNAAAEKDGPQEKA